MIIQIIETKYKKGTQGWSNDTKLGFHTRCNSSSESAQRSRLKFNDPCRKSRGETGKKMKLLPIIAARACSFSEMMKTIWISQNNMPVENSWYIFHSSMTISTDAEILENPDWCPRWHGEEPKSNGQLLTVICKTQLLTLFIHVMKSKIHVWNISSFLD